MATVRTSKGNELPLINLKGKEYLMVAYRLQWLSDDVPNYTIETQILDRTPDSATVKATVMIANEKNELLRRVSATKTETLSDFKDFLEKAETAAVGRALAMLGYGTQHALADLDEGDRLADSPLEAKPKAAYTNSATPTTKATKYTKPIADAKETPVTEGSPKPFKARFQRRNTEG